MPLYFRGQVIGGQSGWIIRKSETQSFCVLTPVRTLLLALHRCAANAVAGHDYGHSACDDVEIGIYLVDEQRYDRVTQEELELTSLSAMFLL